MVCFGEATMNYRRICLTLLVLTFLFPLPAWSAQCYIKKACFAVSEPNLEERVCYLYRHDARMYRSGEISPFEQVMNAPELHPDPLHVDFMEARAREEVYALETRYVRFQLQVRHRGFAEGPCVERARQRAAPRIFLLGHYVPFRAGKGYQYEYLCVGRDRKHNLR